MTAPVHVLQETSASRLPALQSLLAYVEEATRELIWLNEKEDIEITRDWSSKALHVQELERYHQVSDAHVTSACDVVVTS